MIKKKNLQVGDCLIIRLRAIQAIQKTYEVKITKLSASKKFFLTDNTEFVGWISFDDVWLLDKVN